MKELCEKDLIPREKEKKEQKKLEKWERCNARDHGFSIIKVFILSHQTCFDLYEILRRCSIHWDEHGYKVGFESNDSIFGFW